jgi:hypothetical protein
MRKTTIEQAKKYVFALVGYNGSVPLNILTQDSCSEVSRLLGQWLHGKFPKTEIDKILDGNPKFAKLLK